MKRTYKSRISVALVLIVALVCFTPPIVFRNEPNIAGDIICVGLFVLIVVALKGIKYVIDDETLKVYYFYGIHQDINIKTITKIEPSYNLVSSPAGSIKRLAVYYGKYDVVYISPCNQEDFIKQINEIRQ